MAGPAAPAPQTPTPKQPRDLVEWRKAKGTAFDEGHKTFKNTVDLAQQGVAKYLDLHEALLPLNIKDDRCILAFMLLGSHRIVLNAFDLLVERQVFESMALLRSVIEMAADIAKIGEDPALAKVWIKREEDEAAFNKAFKPQFPKGHKLTGPLYRSYEITTNYGSHSNASLFLLHTDIGQDRKSADVKYFLEKNEAVLQHLVHFVVLLGRLLDVYVASLQPLTKTDLKAKVDVWRTAVDVHKQAHKDLFKKTEEA